MIDPPDSPFTRRQFAPPACATTERLTHTARRLRPTGAPIPRARRTAILTPWSRPPARRPGSQPRCEPDKIMKPNRSDLYAILGLTPGAAQLSGSSAGVDGHGLAVAEVEPLGSAGLGHVRRGQPG